MALMEGAELRGQESSAPVWKINHHSGAGGKDGRTDGQTDGRTDGQTEGGGGQQAAGPLKGRTCSTRARRSRQWNVVNLSDQQNYVSIEA